MSESSFRKCCVKTDNIFGRYVEAAVDIPPGELILCEAPAAIIPRWDSFVVCSNCFQQSARTCNQCKFFPLCINCKNHTSSECKFFENLNDIPKKFLLENFAAYGPLKCLLLMEHPNMKEAWNVFLKMESHQEERRNSQEWKELEKTVVRPLIDSGIVRHFKKYPVDVELVQKICSILDVNSFEVRGPSNYPLRGVYPTAALLSHDCVPNVMITNDSNYTLKIFANVLIQKGELVCASYTNPLLGTIQRQLGLKMGKYFDCKCKRCQDPTELGSYMSALTCPQCKGFVVPNESKWSCENCPHSLQIENIDKILSIANKEIIQAQDDLRQMEMLIAKYMPILNPNHYMIIDLKQNVAAILRSICLNSIMKPGKKVLERKLQLCEEIIPVIRIIQPGISRLKSIALYEFVVPFLELARRNFEESALNSEEYLSQLLKGEGLLREALQMLLYEPGDTPEGILTERAFQEFKQLQKAIVEIGAKLQDGVQYNVSKNQYYKNRLLI